MKMKSPLVIGLEDARTVPCNVCMWIRYYTESFL